MKTKATVLGIKHHEMCCVLDGRKAKYIERVTTMPKLSNYLKNTLQPNPYTTKAKYNSKAIEEVEQYITNRK